MKKKILVTGAGGYVGVLLCERLLSLGYEVLALDRYFFGLDKMSSIINNNSLTILKEDIRYFDIKRLKGIYAVMDCAGLSNDATSEIDPKLTIDINYQGSKRIANAAKKSGVSKYIYSSSASVYGEGLKKSLKETDKINPITQYAKSKVECEKELAKLHSDDFCVTILRNSTIFGVSPRMRFDLAINIMTMRAWKDKVIYVMGDGSQWRPFVHVLDVVNAFTAVLESEKEIVCGEIFNVGFNNQNFQIKQIAEHIKDLIPKIKIINIPDNADKRNYNVNFDKINKHLGLKPLMSINDGINEITEALDKGIINPDDSTCYTLQWYQKILEWEKRIEDLKYKNKIF